MQPIGIGMVGSGFMGLTYSEAISKHVRGARLVAVTGGKRAPVLAHDYGVAAEPTLASLLAREDVQAIVLACPDQTHCAQTLAGAAAGKHVLVEKPMAPTVAQCDQMIQACRQAGVNLAVVKTERYRQLTLKAKSMLGDGGIGRVWMLRTVSMFPAGLAQEILDERRWTLEPESGGLFMGIAAHNTDFLLWLAESPAKRVFAQVNSFLRGANRAASVMAQIEFANGIMGHMWISSEVPAPSFPSSEVRFQVVGSKGLLDFENFEYLDATVDGKWERVFVPQRFDYLKEPKSPIRLAPHIGVLQEFVDSIEEHRAPRVGGAEGRAAIEICEAALISARTHQAVELPL